MTAAMLAGCELIGISILSEERKYGYYKKVRKCITVALQKSAPLSWIATWPILPPKEKELWQQVPHTCTWT
eukprot:scaffold1340_cov122-Cylindrotheca_fusiformis.AAC.18